MAKTQEITGNIFENLYQFIEDKFKEDGEITTEICSKIYEVERAVILELIKRDFVEKGLTERVLLYSDTANGLDELTGAK